LITATNRAYDALVKEHSTYVAVIATIRAQILAAVSPTYYEALMDDMHEYNLVSVPDLLAHLDTQYGRYGRLTDIDLENN